MIGPLLSWIELPGISHLLFSATSLTERPRLCLISVAMYRVQFAATAFRPDADSVFVGKVSKIMIIFLKSLRDTESDRVAEIRSRDRVHGPLGYIGQLGVGNRRCARVLQRHRLHLKHSSSQYLRQSRIANLMGAFDLSRRSETIEQNKMVV